MRQIFNCSNQMRTIVHHDLMMIINLWIQFLQKPNFISKIKINITLRNKFILRVYTYIFKSLKTSF
jgi:hypothetical protein